MGRASNRMLPVALPLLALVVGVVACMGRADRYVLAALGALAGIVVLVLMLAWAWRADTVVLDAVSAYALAQARAPALFDEVAALAKLYRIPVPAIACSRTAVPLAFVVGRGVRHATLCVSDGLLETVDSRLLRAVVAQQLAHLVCPAFLARSVAASWSCGLLALTDGHWVLSRLNGLGMAVRALGCTPGQQLRADADAGRRLGDPLLLADALDLVRAGVREERLAPAGRLVAASPLMTVSPFGDDVRAAALALQPDTTLRVHRLEALAGRR